MGAAAGRYFFGEWFRKDDTGAIGNFGVRLIKVKSGTSLQSFAAQAEDGVRKEPGYRRLSEQPSMIGMHASIKRDYVMFVAGSEKVQRRVEEQFFLNGDYGYWLHFETLAEGFDLFQHDLDHLLASFVAIAGGQSRTAGGQSRARRRPLEESRRRFVFRFAFGRPAPFFAFPGDATGTLRVIDNNHLVLTIPGKAVETFSYAVSSATSSSSRGLTLEEPIHYARVALPPAILSGAWRARGHSEMLRLSPGGSFVFGDHTGTYKQKGDLLVAQAQRRRRELTYVFGSTVTCSSSPAAISPKKRSSTV